MALAEKVDEDAKILALKSIMPETLFGEAGVFRGRPCNFYADLRTALIHYLDDKVTVSMMKQSPPISPTNMVQTSGDQGEQGEDEETKNEVTQDEILAMGQQFRKGKGKGKRSKERREHAGTVVKVITTAEIARTTNNTTAGQMVGHGRIRNAARQAKMQAKGGMQARATGTAGETVKAKAKTGKGVVSPKNGKASSLTTSMCHFRGS